MAFEVFTRKSRPTSTVATIGIQTRGTFSLNAAAFQLLVEAQKGKRALSETVKKAEGKTEKGGKDVFIEFLYDSDRKMAGIRIAPPDSQNAYPLRKQKAAESYLVTGKAFLEYNKIDHGKLRRYTGSIHEGGILGFAVEQLKG
jgi:hypothetical protein